MAENSGSENTGRGDLSAVREALITECTDQARSALYTSASFFIWLRTLKFVRTAVWTIAAACSIAAASAVLSGATEYKAVIAAMTLLGVVLPGIMKAVKLDEMISAYEVSAADFKNAEGTLRRAADVWSHKPMDEFEHEARAAFEKQDTARKASLTPPEWCFRSAQKKVKSGDYDPD